MFLEGIQGSVRKGFRALYSEIRKAADIREEGNKYTARAIYLQGSCQMQDIVLPVLFKGLDARKSAKQKKGEIWRNVANISTETWFRVKFQKVLQQAKLFGGLCLTTFLIPLIVSFPQHLRDIVWA